MNIQTIYNSISSLRRQIMYLWGAIKNLTSLTIAPETTSPITLLSTTSTSVFTNEGATASVTFNLPSAVAGYTYTFIVQDANGIVVTANTGDTIRMEAAVTAAAGSVQSSTIGSVIQITAINSTEWIATTILGSWA